jgi:hypothetical protein
MTSMTTGINAGRGVALDRLMVFTGNATPRLAQEVAKHLNLSLGRARRVSRSARRWSPTC